MNGDPIADDCIAAGVLDRDSQDPLTGLDGQDLRVVPDDSGRVPGTPCEQLSPVVGPAETDQWFNQVMS